MCTPMYLLAIFSLLCSLPLNAAHSKLHNIRVSSPTPVTYLSQLPPNLVCLNLNNPDQDLTGYTWYSNVAFDTQIAVNPLNPDNMIIVAQQNVITNANTQSDLPLAVVALYTFDGGRTWNESDLVLSRCVGSTLYQANNNFLSAYFPQVAFDKEGQAYVVSSSFNLFAADQQPNTNANEGSIIAKTTNGGKSWNLVTKADRDDGTCHFLDSPGLATDPYRKDNLYIVSADTTCLVRDTCTDPNFNGNNNITFQKSTTGGSSWTQPSIIASFVSDPSTCTPTPFLNQIVTLPDRKKSLFVTSYIEYSGLDEVYGTHPDKVLGWISKDGGESWTKVKIADNIQHVLACDPDSSPLLPFTDFTGKDMAVNQRSGEIYVVYQDPQFNPTYRAGVVITRSKDGGKTWSKPKPINPKTLSAQTFLPRVAVAKDGTVGVLFYDFRHFKPGDPILSTDVWVSFFSHDLKDYLGEVRLTPTSFDARRTIRGYNGIDLANCTYDYYISNLVDFKAVKNDFVAAFTVTNSACPPVQLPDSSCDAFPLSTDDCNRQGVVFVRIERS